MRIIHWGISKEAGSRGLNISWMEYSKQDKGSHGGLFDQLNNTKTKSQ
jgi:hypothetical protein